MTTAMPDPSSRKILWWTRNFGRPLQNVFAPINDETPDELNALLEMADKRIGDQSAPREQ